MAIGLFRHIFGVLTLLWLLDPLLGYGLTGIYWGIFAVSWLGALITVLCVRHRVPRHARRSPIPEGSDP